MVIVVAMSITQLQTRIYLQRLTCGHDIPGSFIMEKMEPILADNAIHGAPSA